MDPCVDEDNVISEPSCCEIRRALVLSVNAEPLSPA